MKTTNSVLVTFLT